MKKKMSALTIGAAICLLTVQAASASQVTLGTASSANDLFDIGRIFYNASTSTTTIFLDVSAFDTEAPGIDPVTGASVPFVSNSDVLSFSINAAANEQISKVTYKEWLSTSVAYTTGFAATNSTGFTVLNGLSQSMGSFSAMTPTNGISNFALGTSYDIPGIETLVAMTISSNITAIASGNDSSAWVEKAYAAVEITTTPQAAVPVPAPLWLLGSAVTGLLAMRRNRHSA